MDRDGIIKAMTSKIDAIIRSDPNAFKHSQPLLKLNTVDISPRTLKGSQTEFVRSIKNDSRIQNVYTPPKDPAIHIEVPQP